MKEFPKMLYKGNQVSHVHIIVDNGREEHAARQDSYVDYADLPEREAGVLGGGVLAGSSATEIDPDAFVPVEQFDALGERIVELEQEVSDLKTELVTAHLTIEDLRNAQNHSTDGQAQAATDTAGANVGSADFSAWTNAQLQDAIIQSGKTFNQRDTKAELIAILTGEK